MLRLGRKGKGWSWACGPSPRNDRAGGGAARAQGHSVIVTMATATSQLGTWKRVGGGSSQVPESRDRERNNQRPGGEAERDSDSTLKTCPSQNPQSLVHYGCSMNVPQKQKALESQIPRDDRERKKNLQTGAGSVPFLPAQPHTPQGSTESPGSSYSFPDLGPQAYPTAQTTHPQQLPSP